MPGIGSFVFLCIHHSLGLTPFQYFHAEFRVSVGCHLGYGPLYNYLHTHLRGESQPDKLLIAYLLPMDLEKTTGLIKKGFAELMENLAKLQSPKDCGIFKVKLS